MIMGDFNADTFRTRAIDHKHRSWCRELQELVSDVLYTQAAPNSFRNGQGDYSHIDHVLLIKPWNWYELKQWRTVAYRKCRIATPFHEKKKID